MVKIYNFVLVTMALPSKGWTKVSNAPSLGGQLVDEKRFFLVGVNTHNFLVPSRHLREGDTSPMQWLHDASAIQYEVWIF